MSYRSLEAPGKAPLAQKQALHSIDARLASPEPLSSIYATTVESLKELVQDDFLLHHEEGVHSQCIYFCWVRLTMWGDDVSDACEGTAGVDDLARVSAEATETARTYLREISESIAQLEDLLTSSREDLSKSPEIAEYVVSVVSNSSRLSDLAGPTVNLIRARRGQGLAREVHQAVESHTHYTRRVQRRQSRRATDLTPGNENINPEETCLKISGPATLAAENPFRRTTTFSGDQPKREHTSAKERQVSPNQPWPFEMKRTPPQLRSDHYSLKPFAHLSSARGSFPKPHNMILYSAQWVLEEPQNSESARLSAMLLPTPRQLYASIGRPLNAEKLPID